MNKHFLQVYEIVCKVDASHERHADAMALRRKYWQKLAQNSNEMVKQAFDTRYINQETDYIARRNLQTYHRSAQYIDKDASEKLKTFIKLKTAVDTIKDDYLGDPDWFDSYARILSASLDRTLRIEQKDMDFFKPQMDYLEELMYLRYRLRPEDINRLGEPEIRQILLDRDEKLLHKSIYRACNLGGQTKTTAASPGMVKGPDNLIDKLFGDVKATKDNKEVQRSVTITINDKLVEPNLTKES
jgi:hypothetical protein